MDGKFIATIWSLEDLAELTRNTAFLVSILKEGIGRFSRPYAESGGIFQKAILPHNEESEAEVRIGVKSMGEMVFKAWIEIADKESESSRIIFSPKDDGWWVMCACGKEAPFWFRQLAVDVLGTGGFESYRQGLYENSGVDIEQSLRIVARTLMSTARG